MPHSIIEHSFAIPKDQADELLLLVNQTIAESVGNFNIYKCKARMELRENFMIGNADLDKNFMHITIKILEGRDLDTRQTLSTNFLKIIGDFLHDKTLSIKPVDLSVDIVQIVAETYQNKMINRINI
ncbi:MAG: 5-carboxymethyl-2-hydroxymuconate isomerase [Myxococcota bacterium]|jgi:5-carboxymethyl-2-hydroxymuconate isomerase